MSKEETINKGNDIQWMCLKKAAPYFDGYLNSTILACHCFEAMQAYADETNPIAAIDFGTWYSGMDREKVERAYQRYLKEVITKEL